MNNKKLLLANPIIEITIERLCEELIENHGDFSDSVLIGLQPRGVFLANRIKKVLDGKGYNISLGILDATFYRDDFRRRSTPLTPNTTHIPFLIEDKRVVLVDDVIATGRMIRAAIDALQAFGRPVSIELLCLVNRSYNRDLPIQPDYVGKKVNTMVDQEVLVEWTEQGLLKDTIWLLDNFKSKA